jgi:hypothetical protein
MDELLAVITLSKISLRQSLVVLNTSIEFDVLSEVIRKTGMFTVVPFAGD